MKLPCRVLLAGTLLGATACGDPGRPRTEEGGAVGASGAEREGGAAVGHRVGPRAESRAEVPVESAGSGAAPGGAAPGAPIAVPHEETIGDEPVEHHVKTAVNADSARRQRIVLALARLSDERRSELIDLLQTTDADTLIVVADALARFVDASPRATAALEARAQDPALRDDVRDFLLMAAGSASLGEGADAKAVSAALADERRYVRKAGVTFLIRRRPLIARHEAELRALARNEGTTSLGESASFALELIPRSPDAAKVAEAVAAQKEIRDRAIAQQRERDGKSADVHACTVDVGFRTWRAGAYLPLDGVAIELAADEPLQVLISVRGAAVRTGLESGGAGFTPAIAAVRRSAGGTDTSVAVDIVVAQVSSNISYREEVHDTAWQVTIRESAERRKERVDALVARLRRMPDIDQSLKSLAPDDPKLIAFREACEAQIKVNAAGEYRFTITHPQGRGSGGAARSVDVKITPVD